MFERFTDRARRVVVLSQEEARRLGHDYIGTEHLLLGMIHEDGGVAALALTELGVSLEDVRRRVEEIIGPGTGTGGGHIPFTPRAKKVLELALKEALGLGHKYIGTEHILLGLVREGEGVAAQVLVRLTGGLSEVRKKVIELIGMAVGSGQEGSGQEGEQPSGWTGYAPSEEETGPRCGTCRALLSESAVHRVMPVPDEAGANSLDVVFVYCRACGRAIDAILLASEG